MNRRAFLLAAALGVTASPDLAFPQSPASGDPLFDAWKQDFMDRAAGVGWSRTKLAQIFGKLEPDPKVIARDRAQPELAKPIGDYISSAVSEARVEEGRNHRGEASAWLDPIAARYGVPASVLVGVWCIESNYGRLQGAYDVIRSLATLAAEGRRREWAESQLFAALRILFTDQASRDQLKGSWAGAMGQTQFTPEDYLSWAVDGDGDGRRDIWASPPDALASTANFLAHKAAWRRGESWTREVSLPREFDYSLAETTKQPIKRWTELGVRTADGLPWREADQGEPAALLLPAGWSGPAFLAFPNHYAIRVYNNSMAYALAVGLLADRIAGGPPLVRPWPSERPIPLADRIAAQEALARLGYDVGTPDGVLGLRTRQAAREWQKSRGLPADGYLTYELIQKLKAETGVRASPPRSPASPT